MAKTEAQLRAACTKGATETKVAGNSKTFVFGLFSDLIDFTKELVGKRLSVDESMELTDGQKAVVLGSIGAVDVADLSKKVFLRSSTDVASVIASEKELFTDYAVNTILKPTGDTESIIGYKTSNFIANTYNAYLYLLADFNTFDFENYANACLFDMEGHLIERRMYAGLCIVPIPKNCKIKISLLNSNSAYLVSSVKDLQTFAGEVESKLSKLNSDLGKKIFLRSSTDVASVIASEKELFTDYAVNTILKPTGDTESIIGYKTSNFIANTYNAYLYLLADFNTFDFENYANACLFDMEGHLIERRMYAGLCIVPIPKNCKIKISLLNSNSAYLVSSVKDLQTFAGEVESKLSKLEGYDNPKLDILAVGTSIPEGALYFNYACTKLGHNIYNKALGASGLVKGSSYLNSGRDGRDLCEKISEKEARYRPFVTNGTITEATLDMYKTWGYESLVLPYIDGTIASCKVILFDHAYNDGGFIVNEISNGNLDFTPDENADRETFVGAFKFFLYQVYKIDPTIKIIICGYHEDQSDVTKRRGAAIRAMHEAICKQLGLTYLDMAKRLGFNFKHVPNSANYLDDLNNTYGTSFSKQWADSNGNITFYQMYNPDGVHPHSDPTGKAIAKLNHEYLSALRSVL